MSVFSKVYNRDCIDVLSCMDSNSVNLILCDIPYGEVNRGSNGLRALDKGLADDCRIDIKKMIDNSVRVCSGSFYFFAGLCR